MHSVQAHGASIPALGFGTWKITGPETAGIVRHALDVGYRHLDTAQVYGNEAEVGRAIAESGVPRDDIFLTTKVWPERYRRDDLPVSVEESLQKLRTDYVDLLLLHWPVTEVPLAETLEALNEVRDAGYARHIGVSNFTIAHLDEAIRLSDAPLVTNQIEYHPFMDQRALIRATRRAGLAVTAYSPLAQGKVLHDRALRKIGEAHDKTAAQVALRWVLQQEGVVTIPKASGPEHCKANLEVFDFTLTDQEMEAIHALAHPAGRMTSPDGLAPAWD